MVSQEKIRIPHVLNDQFYAQVVTKVSIFTLKKTHKQFLKATDSTLENPLPPCSGIFTLSMDLPCSHVILERHTNNQSLQLIDFHTHWRLQKESSTHVLSEPENSIQ
ncbi:2772_t:CDS:1 [Gigaspora margarita]|uniref:2772_t:CDS:1 n=1 Tax=Gigaspora margarita TaxID=4874 RepID=A0ABN7UUS8_GIGMA|nr:2772_t:CDS:1 [Gigaspora margarita]